MHFWMFQTIDCLSILSIYHFICSHYVINYVLYSLYLHTVSYYLFTIHSVMNIILSRQTQLSQYYIIYIY